MAQELAATHVHVVPRGGGDGLRPSWPWRLKPGEELGPGEVAPEGWEPRPRPGRADPEA